MAYELLMFNRGLHQQAETIYPAQIHPRLFSWMRDLIDDRINDRWTQHNETVYMVKEIEIDHPVGKWPKWAMNILHRTCCPGSHLGVSIVYF